MTTPRRGSRVGRGAAPLLKLRAALEARGNGAAGGLRGRGAGLGRFWVGASAEAGLTARRRTRGPEPRPQAMQSEGQIKRSPTWSWKLRKRVGLEGLAAGAVLGRGGVRCAAAAAWSPGPRRWPQPASGCQVMQGATPAELPSRAANTVAVQRLPLRACGACKGVRAWGAGGGQARRRFWVGRAGAH